MIGTKGTLKHIRTHIHNVPILFCPVCHRVEVHHLAQNEYEILAEYAHGDGAYEVDFTEYVDSKKSAELFENCVNHEDEEPLDVVVRALEARIVPLKDLLEGRGSIGADRPHRSIAAPALPVIASAECRWQTRSLWRR